MYCVFSCDKASLNKGASDQARRQPLWAPVKISVVGPPPVITQARKIRKYNLHEPDTFLGLVFSSL